MTLYVFFFFKQKTAYAMRMSDWSSDVCSSDLACMMADRQRIIAAVEPPALPFLEPGDQARVDGHGDAAGFAGRQADLVEAREPPSGAARAAPRLHQIGRASCRERVCTYV